LAGSVNYHVPGQAALAMYQRNSQVFVTRRLGRRELGMLRNLIYLSGVLLPHKTVSLSHEKHLIEKYYLHG